MTDNLGQSQVLPYLAGLSKMPNEITIISCEKDNNFTRSAVKISNLLNFYKINWTPIKYHSNPPIFSTVFDIFNLIRQAKKLYKINKFDIVHCRSYISAFVGLYLQKKHNVKFVFDMRGFYADERIDGKIWSLNNPLYNIIYKYFKRKEKEFLSNANYTISLTEKGKEEIHKWNFIENQPIPIKVIPCCADMEHFDFSKISIAAIMEKKSELGFNPDDLILSYLGSIGTWYLPDEMMTFFKSMLLKYPIAKFFFISGDDENYIKDKAENAGISRDKIIVKKADRIEVPLFLALSDISIFFIKPVFSKKASSPTKMGEIMSVGKPYICNSGVGDVDRIVNESKTGILINDFSVEEFNIAISKINDILKLKQEYIREQAEKYYSLKIGIERYNDVYKELFK
jgi:glycosyltransferase involved in cell wall biosynthesis